MPLDLTTLAVLDVFILALMTSLVAHAWYRGRDGVLGYLAVFLALSATGTLLSSLRGHWGFFLTIGLGNAALLLSAACLWLALRHFVGFPPCRRVALAAPLLWLLLLLWPAFSASLTGRLVVFSLISSFYTALAGTELWRGRHRVRVDIRPALLLLCVNAVFYLVRAGLDRSEPFDPRGIGSVSFTLVVLETLLMAIGMSFAVLAMVNERAERRHRQAALTDPLTGIGNRRAFISQAEAVLAACARAQRPAAVLLCDLDHFKRINDSHGHAAGDQALVEFARLLHQCVRHGDLCARIGGEEFACLVADAGMDEAAQLAERVRTELLARVLPGGLELSVSIGVADVRAGAYQLDAALVHADQALYQAKHLGRNRVACHAAARQDGLHQI